MQIVSEKISKQKIILWIVVLSIITAAVLVYWYFQQRESLIEQNIEELKSAS